MTRAYGIWINDHGAWLRSDGGPIFVFYCLGAAKAQLDALPNGDEDVFEVAEIGPDGEPLEVEG